MAHINTDAILGARYEAEEVAKALHLTYWLKRPGDWAYHLDNAKEHFARLVSLMAQIEPGDAEPPAPSGDADVGDA